MDNKNKRGKCVEIKCVDLDNGHEVIYCVLALYIFQQIVCTFIVQSFANKLHNTGTSRFKDA